MLNHTTTQMPVALRLYENNAYGTTYGKGLYRRALYNGTIELIDAKLTYLVDFYGHEDWANLARTDEDMEILHEFTAEPNALYSWVQHYDRLSKQKARTTGFCKLDTVSLEVALLLYDERNGVSHHWRLSAKPCKQHRVNVNSPQLLATNADLAVV